VDSNSAGEAQTVADVRRVVSSFTSAIAAWFATEPSSSVKEVTWRTSGGTSETRVLEYDIATRGVSLHLPLHRALGGMLAESCREWGPSLLNMLLANEKHDQTLSFVSALLEGPLRAQVCSVSFMSRE
jgi:hypothetical protein